MSSRNSIFDCRHDRTPEDSPTDSLAIDLFRTDSLDDERQSSGLSSSSFDDLIGSFSAPAEFRHQESLLEQDAAAPTSDVADFLGPTKTTADMLAYALDFSHALPSLERFTQTRSEHPWTTPKEYFCVLLQRLFLTSWGIGDWRIGVRLRSVQFILRRRPASPGSAITNPTRSTSNPVLHLGDDAKKPRSEDKREGDGYGRRKVMMQRSLGPKTSEKVMGTGAER
ncbi:unnamed protein product [Arabidopsis arenosa]|uniref:Uncharacterized protein n=1 Tax=Arabidopsis arenosa TaxID=38785 RepID=A0A8S1ZMT2_ARAAE|nr:unnamed protein product [Arabidopsis arenosa]